MKGLLAHVHVVFNFLFQVIFVFLLFLGMVIYANEVETKETRIFFFIGRSLVSV